MQNEVYEKYQFFNSHIFLNASDMKYLRETQFSSVQEA
jgi:hypothetical protein